MNMEGHRLPELAIECQLRCFGKISRMKGVSESLLPIVLYAMCQDLSFDETRKKSGRNTPIYWG